MITEDKDQRRRRIHWWLLMAALSLPAILVGFMLLLTVVSQLKLGVDSLMIPVFLATLLSVIAGAVVVGRLGPRRGWHTRRMLRLGWGLVILCVVTFILVAVPAFQKVSRSSRNKAIQANLRQLSAAEDQFSYENPDRIFILQDELVGPDRYLKQLYFVAGEDYRAMFPHRTGALFTVTGPGKLRVWYDPDVDPTAPEVDGLHIVKLKDGRRFETTWKGGVPDGPFRAYRADGTLWGEATYVQGRVIGPSLIHLPDGRKFDELTEDASKAR
jgi:hypothetical protein